MKHNARRTFLTFVLIFSILGIGVAQTRDSATATDINVALGEPGLSFKYESTIGTYGEPYPYSGDYINQPEGLFVDSDGALYVAEQMGSQVIKYGSDGNYEMSFGVYGNPWHHDNYLYQPSSVSVAENDHVFVVYQNAVKEYGLAGNYIRSFPEEDPWASGNDNGHFDYPYDLVFSNDGTKLFISDVNNKRVQVFSFDVDGKLVYQETLDALTALMQEGDFNGIRGLDIDSSGRLYVNDYVDARIHRCTFNPVTPQWECENFFGVSGEPGDDLQHLNYPVDIYVDPSDNIFIADSNNFRILKCTVTGSCEVFAGGEWGQGNDQLKFVTGITGDASGNIYVSDKDNFRMQVFDSDGNYLKTYGTTGVPYVTDNNHINTAQGVAVDSDGSILITEGAGYRLIKLDAQGTQLWTVGEAGVWGDDNEHFGAYWGGMEGSPAVDANHKVYVADSPNNKIKIYNGDGTYFNSFGSWGQGNYEFDHPTFVSISPVNGDIYVADSYNRRVQVFTANLEYKATLGVTGEIGSDDNHFGYPQGIAIDESGNIFIGDLDNYRVQKCSLNDSGYACETLIGEPGVNDGEFGHIVPRGIVLDDEGRVYVADDWNSRVQVFDANGAFLTSIEGRRDMPFATVEGVAANKSGEVFIADLLHHSIQIFSPGVPNWKQVNLNGFGNRSIAMASSIAEFESQLYVGTANWGDGGNIWRSTDGEHWTSVSNSLDPGSTITDLEQFGGQLYAAISWGQSAGQIWRSEDGTNWSQVVENGFNNAANGGVHRLIEFNGYLYAGTSNSDSGTEIWRSSSGDTGLWNKVVDGGNGDGSNYQINTFEIFNGYLYTGTENTNDGAEIWRTNNGTSWQQANLNGFGDSDNVHIGSIVVFNDMLYASTQNGNGAEIWRSANGINWTKVIDGGLGNPNNIKIESLYVFDGQLFAASNNETTGVNVWKSVDGASFEQINIDGFGDSNNFVTLWNTATIDFNDQFYIGTRNDANGGELWRYEPRGSNIFLPMIMNNYQAPVENAWNIVTSPTTQTLNAVKMLSAIDGWAVGNAGTVLHWNGSTWSEYSSPTSNNLNGLALLDLNNAWAVGDSGTILNWNGSTWQSFTSPTSLKLNEIYLLSANNGWIVGESGTLLRWDGSSWQSYTSPAVHDLYALDFLSDTDGWAVGGLNMPGSGTSEILKWDGTDWTVYDHEYSIPALDKLYDIDMVSPTFGIALGMNNVGEKWNGYFWTAIAPFPYLMRHNGVDFLSESDGWSVGWIHQESNILHWVDTTWEREPCPVDSELMDIFMLDSSHGWIVGAEGVILRFGN